MPCSLVCLGLQLPAMSYYLGVMECIDFHRTDYAAERQKALLDRMTETMITESHPFRRKAFQFSL